MVKNSPAMQKTWVPSLGLGRSPGGGHGNPLQYSFLENSHGQRSLVGYSPWNCKESNMTEQLSTAQHITEWLVKDFNSHFMFKEGLPG